MGQITFIEHDGTEHQVKLKAGKSLMELATDNLVPGIDADCGGACACGTCHVILSPTWFTQAGAAWVGEQQILGMKPEVENTSRLACQITVTDEMDGMQVRLPEFQM